MKKHTNQPVSTANTDGRLASLEAAHTKHKETCRQLQLSLSATDAEIKKAKRRKLHAKEALEAYKKSIEPKSDTGSSQDDKQAVASEQPEAETESSASYLSEITHVRSLSRLGPNGLTRINTNNEAA